MRSVACLILLAISAVTAVQKMPKTWKVCNRSDPHLDSCLKDAVTRVLKDLKNGYPQLKIPKIDPLKVDSISLRQGTSSAVGITIDFKNLEMMGLSDAVVDKVHADYPRNLITIEFHVNGPFRLSGDYTSKGRILLIPINGAGKSSLVFDNFKGKIYLHTKVVKKGGVKHLETYKTDLNVDTTRLHLNFKRTVNVNEGLGKNLNTFLNENWREILQDLKPAISQSFGNKFKDFTNRIFEQIPMDELTPA